MDLNPLSKVILVCNNYLIPLQNHICTDCLVVYKCAYRLQELQQLKLFATSKTDRHHPEFCSDS